MELAGLLTTQPVSRDIMNSHVGDAIALNNVPTYCIFKPVQVELEREYGTSRPCLRIGGFVSRVAPREQLPYDVRLINFDADSAPFMTVDYAFTNEQLKQLVDKGLFEKGFTPPRNKLQDVELEFITDVDMVVVPPESDAYPPLVVVDPRGMDLVVLDDNYLKRYNEQTYDFAAEFDNFMPEVEAEASKFVDIDNSLDLGELETESYVDRQDLVKDGSLSVIQRLQELAGGQLSLTAYDVLSVIEPNEKQLGELAALQKARVDGTDVTAPGTPERDGVDTAVDIAVDTAQSETVETDDLEIIDFGDDDEFDLDDDLGLNADAEREVEVERDRDTDTGITVDTEADADGEGAANADVDTELDVEPPADATYGDNSTVHKKAEAKKKAEVQRKLEEILRQTQQDTPDTGLSL